MGSSQKQFFHMTGLQKKNMASNSDAMTDDHPLARATVKFFECVKAEGLAAAESASGVVALLAKRNLRVSSHFSGMGGAEMAFYKTGKMFDMDIHLVSQCDVTHEALRVSCPP